MAKHSTLALLETGVLISWGLPNKGLLGRDILGPESIAKSPGIIRLPEKSAALGRTFFAMNDPMRFRGRKDDFVSRFIVKVCCGVYHTLALTNAGEVYVWGANTHC
jgi:alpha-tubulin suppressor-like RCC1 family protein